MIQEIGVSMIQSCGTGIKEIDSYEDDMVNRDKFRDSFM